MPRLTCPDSRKRQARLIACSLRRSANMRHGRGRGRHSGGATQSQQIKPITMATIFLAAARKANTGKKPYQSIASSPIPGGSIKFTAMFGSGQRIVITKATPVLLAMALPGQPEGVITAFFAAVPGSTFRRTSARRSGAGAFKASGTSPASGWPGRLPLKSLHLYFLCLTAAKGSAQRSLRSSMPSSRNGL